MGIVYRTQTDISLPIIGRKADKGNDSNNSISPIPFLSILGILSQYGCKKMVMGVTQCQGDGAIRGQVGSRQPDLDLIGKRFDVGIPGCGVGDDSTTIGVYNQDNRVIDGIQIQDGSHVSRIRRAPVQGIRHHLRCIPICQVTSGNHVPARNGLPRRHLQ